MIVEAIVVFGALALVGGLKAWLTWRRIKTAKPMKELPPDDEEAPLQRR